MPFCNMVRKTPSGFFAVGDELPYHISRGFDRVNRSNSSFTYSQSEHSQRPSSPIPRAAEYGQEKEPEDHARPPPAIPSVTEQKSEKKPEDYARPFLNFMTSNPTVFHAVRHFAVQLIEHGYTELSERDTWKIKPGGKYFVSRNGSSLIAFAVGKDYKPGNGVGMIAGHVDALTIKLKPISKLPDKAGYVQLGVAPYAGGLNSTWWDRDLGIGGRVLVKDHSTGKIKTELLKIDQAVARIPTLAPHFGAAAVGPFNKETQMVPIIGLDAPSPHGHVSQTEVIDIKPGTFAATQPERLVRVISKMLNIQDYSSIVGWELEMFDTQGAAFGGLDLELIFAGRLDDKLCCFAAIEALLASPDSDSSETIKLVGCFDDEEIGSFLRQGARSNFMSGTLERVCESIASREGGAACGPNLFGQTMANSFLISSDVIHAVNPNFLSAYLENHSPRLNVGVAISADPNGHMTTDGVSTALLQRVAEKCGSTLQVFQIRNDVRSGGTIGPILSSRLGVRAIDAGIPQLSMHSIRATTGTLDPGLGVKLFKGFFDHYQEVDKEFQ